MWTKAFFWLNLASGIYQSIVIYGQPEPRIVNIAMAAAGFFVSGLILGQNK